MTDQKPDLAPPGIRFLDIHLISSEFRATAPVEKLKYHLGLTHMAQDIEETEDGASEMYCLFSFDLMSGIDDPPCVMRCTYAASYRRSADAVMNWEQFTPGMALSHVIAYVREFVMNVTTRSMLPRLFLPPLNANALVADYERSKPSQEVSPEEG